MNDSFTFLQSKSWLLAAEGSNAALLIFLIYTLAVFGLAALSNRLLQSKNFLSEYFLGSRSLGLWAFALTFAATSASGGSFTGFPARIYTHGWILGLWIASYMVVPICTMGLIGKRVNQVARLSDSITVPDVMRDRFRSPMLGLLAVVLIIFFMSFNLVAQFKAGSNILVTLLGDVPAFQSSASSMASWFSGIELLKGVDPAYLLCLFTFSAAVILYTTYGGFHAVVWTDVMQGIVMVIGVVIMLPLAIFQVGGLSNATREMSEMIPPRYGLAEFQLTAPVQHDVSLSNVWFTVPKEETGENTKKESDGSDADFASVRLFRVNGTLLIRANENEATSKSNHNQTVNSPRIQNVKVVEILTPTEMIRQLERLKQEPEKDRLTRQLIQLKQSQISWYQTHDVPEKAQRIEEIQQEMESLSKLEFAILNDLHAKGPVPDVSVTRDFRYGHNMKGVYVTGPGPMPPEVRLLRTSTSEAMKKPKPRDLDGWLPLSLAISFFCMWAISGTGQPQYMVRLMAFRDTVTLRRSIMTVSLYYSMIYFPLVIIFCCARILIPGMEMDADRIMPQMAVTLTENIGQGWLAGLLIAAPFAAIMSTVDSFLLMISSAMVRDIYQRNLNPAASETTIKRLSYLCTLLVGLGATLGAINPPQFLQDIIIYTGSGLASCFLAPVIFALYWPRSNLAGTIGGMLVGFTAHLSMYVLGFFFNGSFFHPYRLFNFDPILVGLSLSFLGTWVITKMTSPPPQDLVLKYFCRKKGEHT